MCGWSTKRSRYSELSALRAEAFDITADSEEMFSNVKDFLCDVISKRQKVQNGQITGCTSIVRNHDSDNHCIGDVHDPEVVATKGAPRKSAKGAVIDKNDDVQNKRIKSSREKQNKCSVCHLPGHNKRTCM